MRSSLSLAFILKNEAETIDRVIKSFWFEGKPLYDELVIGIDKSTTDRTYQKALDFTNDIYWFEWENNFSKARNSIIDKCHADWIFMPDGHEFLTKDSAPVLRAILEDPANKELRVISPYIGMYDTLTCCDLNCGPAEFPAFIFPRPLLFINDPTIRFSSAIHNYIEDTGGPRISRLLPELRLEHRQSARRLQYRRRQRFEMNLKGLAQVVDQHPENDRAKFQLAATRSEFMDYKTVINDYQKVLEETTDQDQEAQVLILLGCMLCQAGDRESNALLYERARQTMEPLVENAGSRAEIYFVNAWAAYGLGRYEEAIEWAECITNREPQLPLTNFFVIPDIYFVYPWDILCQAKRRLGDMEGAVEAAKMLVKWKPRCKTAKNNLDSLLERVSA